MVLEFDLPQCELESHRMDEERLAQKRKRGEAKSPRKRAPLRRTRTDVMLRAIAALIVQGMRLGDRERKQQMVDRLGRVCPKCNKTKPRDAFGFGCHNCLDCTRAYEVEKLERDRVRLRELKKRCRDNGKSSAADKKRSDEDWRLIRRHYGDRCRECGETDLSLLTVDHVGQDIGQLRKIQPKKHSGKSLRRKLVRDGFPGGFRILCRQCNIMAYWLHRAGFDVSGQGWSRGGSAKPRCQ